MDGGDLDRERHRRALEALARINRVSLASARVARAVERVRAQGVSPVGVLDVACGGGDVLLGVARWSARRGLPVRLAGCDVSAVALEHAREAFDRAGEEGRFFRQDVVEHDLPRGYHVVSCSLFLHHLEEADAVRLLRGMAGAAEVCLLVQDLRRSRLGYLFALFGLHVLTRSDVARSDGLASVRAAFTLAEAVQLCRRADLRGARVSAAWPQRFTIDWSRA